MDRVPVVDSAAQLGPAAHGAVVACGSHGALFPAWLAARAGVRAIVFNDAGIGRHSAGIAGVAWLAGLGIAACAVDYRSARIGDGADTLRSGRVTTVNDVAAAAGCRPGQPCRQVLRCLLEEAPVPDPREVPEIGETRIRIPHTGHRAVWALDSILLARPDDHRAVIVSGSHGALHGGREDGLLATDVFAAFFNDAGGGKDNAGVARLPVLDARGVAAAAVSCHTARIGDGRSTYDTGVISRLNETARYLELREGMSAREAVARLVGLG
jgi:hypothetical protein